MKKKKKSKKKTKGISMIELLVAVTLMGILSVIAIIAVSRYKEDAISKDYDALAKSSYNAMEEYLMSNPYDKAVSLELLEEDSFISNIKDPREKNKDCTGSVKVEVIDESNGIMNYGNYTVYLCCSNFNKEYTFPGGKSKILTDISKCTVEDELEPPEIPTQEDEKITCDAGKYLQKGKTSCSTCKNAYYCPGGTWYKNSTKDQGLNSCPSGYNNSAAASSRNTQCYMKVSKNHYVKKTKENISTDCPTGQIKEAHNVYYGSTSKCTNSTIKCVAGKYLPKNKTTCAICIQKYYCPGGTFTYSTSKNQGLTPCPEGYKNSPSGSSRNTQCYMNVKENYYVKKSKDKSPTQCSSGQGKEAHKVNYTSTSKCNTSTIKCAAGKYLPKNKTTCVTCIQKNYCPGGTFTYNTTKDQGINPCPEGYKNSPSGSSKDSQCYMQVPTNNYVKKSKDKSPTPCSSGQTKDAHTVKYGNISTCSSISITVTYDCNGGTGGGTQTFTTGVAGQKFNKKCTKSGKRQDGWMRKKSNTSKDYKIDNDVTDNWILTYSPSITLYAYWEDVSIKCNSGYYVKRNELSCTKCTQKNYCPGGTYTFNTSSEQGIFPCPDGYNNSEAGSSKITQCYINVVAGKYIKTKKSTTGTSCSSGTYKAAHTVFYDSTSKCDSCPTGYSNSPTGSTKEIQCYMKVSKDKYVAKAKDSTSTVCATGYEKAAHNVNYKDTSKCEAKSYTCKEGKYLKKFTTTCSDCTSGHYCSGGTYTYSTKKDQGLKDCPKGYTKSPAGSSKAAQCYMKVSKNHYVKKEKDNSAIKCPTNTSLASHDVNYGKTSGPCKCAGAPSVKTSSSTTGDFKCIVGGDIQYQDGANYFTISGCTNELNGFICYHNPNGANCLGKKYYKKNTHYNNGYGHIAFKVDKWAYYRSSEQAWAQICNESKCANYYKSY